MSTEDDVREHNCAANLAATRNDFTEGGGEVIVYRDCTVCGQEMETVYEYSETYPSS